MIPVIHEEEAVFKLVDEDLHNYLASSLNYANQKMFGNLCKKNISKKRRRIIGRYIRKGRLSKGGYKYANL